MTQKKSYKTFGQFLKQAVLPSDLSPVFWLWRWSFITRQTERGFVLPTVTLLLIMLSLVVGTLVFRTFGRTTEVIGQRRQQALYNAATPAIERAKSKIEYLFTESGLPVLATDEDVENSLEGEDYDLPTLGSATAENRLDLDLDGTVDNAWLFQMDTDGDGTQEAVAYSILSRATNLIDENATPTPTDSSDDTLYSLSSDADLNKARAKVVRNGPLVQTRGANTSCPDATALSPIAGWERQATNTSKLRKALQVHAVVIDSNSSTSATIEFQQDRQVNFGNKWGAWFRSDLELHAGSAFNWNGAMHTEGSYFIGDGGGNVRLFLISSPNSCVYEEDASEITMRQQDDGTQGQFVRGRLRGNTFGTGTNVSVDTYADSGLGTSASVGSDKDSIRDDASKPDPDDVALNPIILFTTNQIQGRGTDNTNRDYRDTDSTNPKQDTGDSFDWETSTANERIFNPSIDIPVPYLDDTYRADDRWGPKIVYDERLGVEVAQISGVSLLGEDITSNPGTLPAGVTTDFLLENDPLEDLTDGDEAGFGLDGYWERRARRAGVRMIVGQRLELGNMIEWFGDSATHAAIDAAAASGATSIVVDDGNGAAASGLGVGSVLRIGSGTHTISSVTPDTPTTDEDTYTITPGLTAAVTDGTPITIEPKIDPLYPPAGTYLSQATPLPMPSGRAHEIRQWRTLRDNLAASQATAVYHYRADTDGDGTVEIGEGGEFPVACLATTAHPGTETADRNSRTFTYYDLTDGNLSTTPNNLAIKTDFLKGQGTNGLEFSAPFKGDASTFQTQINNANSPLRVALTNLAYFAGDPNGAFPATQNVITGAMDATNEVISPYPLMTMWGNFSELRRVIRLLQTGTTYANLSPADQSTLHSATCTLGMLAYNINVAVSEFKNGDGAGEPTLSTVATNFVENVSQLLDGNSTGGNAEIYGIASIDDVYNPTTRVLTCGADNREYQDGVDTLNPPLPAGYLTGQGATPAPDATTLANFLGQFTIAQWMCAVGRDTGGISVAEAQANFENIMAQLYTYILEVSVFQIDRDRALGFREGSYSRTDATFAGSSIDWDPATGYVTYGSGGNTVTLTTGCHPQIIKNLLSGRGEGLGLDDKSISTALAICGTSLDLNVTLPIRYPSLFYLFPFAGHYHNGAFLLNNDGYTSVRTAVAALAKPLTEANQDGTGNSYANDAYIRSTSVNGATTVKFLPVEDGLGSCTTAGCSTTSADRDGVVDPADNEDISDFVTYLDIRPVTPPTTDTNWKTPVQATTGTITSASFVTDRHLIGIDTNNDGTINTYMRPAFIDMGMFNSREQMAVRTLRMDLDQMRQKRIGNAACTWVDPLSGTEPTDDTNGLCWLPLPTLLEVTGSSTNSGAIIYAFREDAVREDAIARPTTLTLSCDADATVGTADDDLWLSSWTTLITAANATALATSNLQPYFTDAIGNLLGQTGTNQVPQDPPINPCTQVSPKPVDFYADPDRRPHGFMLTNGTDLRRKAGTSTWDTDGRGISFISDNPVYIHGDFNIHSEAANNEAASLTNRIEEFDKDTANQLLTSNWSNFYTRSTLDFNFARAEDGTEDTDTKADTWRVSAIVSDAITTLSSSFTPGYADRGILWDTDGAAEFNTDNSYGGISILRNSTAANAGTATEVHNTKTWWREDETPATGTVSSPIKLSRRGLPIYSNSGTPTEYGFITTPSTSAEYFEVLNADDGTGKRSRINGAVNTRIHSVLVSGNSPARNTQDTGGLNNFIRQIEHWNGDTLSIFGSLVQLNFSTSTALFDQDSWEPRTLVSGESNKYYWNPARDFGFDVGLLYVPPDPVASRFSSPSNIRSEFYQELAIDDPYIINLRCARRDYNGDGQITTADATAAGDLNGDGTTGLQDAQVDPKATACSP